MASSLRAKLNAIKATSAAAPEPRLAGGLECYVASSPMPAALYSPAPEALRRIGWNGRIFDIEKCLFIDTETTGLSHGAGTVAFLVGAGYIKDGTMTVEQFFMRDYSNEPELLSRLEALMARFSCVVSFNGKTFDMPLLRSRFIMNRMRPSEELFDLDLITPARRVWKLRLESCRLSNIEEKVLGIHRVGDLPGSEVPARYFEFLKTGDMALVEDIISHNRQDIFTLGILLDRLLSIYANPEKQRDIQDLYSLGRALERQGESRPARDLYRLSAVPRPAMSVSGLRANSVAGQANMRLFRLCLRSGDVSGAVETLEQMLQRRQMGILPHIELAKIYEHRLNDLDKALAHTQAALSACTDEDTTELTKRKDRLRVKIARRAAGGKEPPERKR